MMTSIYLKGRKSYDRAVIVGVYAAVVSVWCIVAIGAAILVANSAHAEPAKMHVAKSATCGCCNAWVEAMAKAGFAVDTQNMESSVLARFKTKNGINADHASCHTARVGGYTIEGHVPAREVKRLLAERPDAVGLAVPGMPIGSPGMEVGDTRDPYDVLLIKKDGTTEVFAHYPAKK